MRTQGRIANSLLVHVSKLYDLCNTSYTFPWACHWYVKSIHVAWGVLYITSAWTRHHSRMSFYETNQNKLDNTWIFNAPINKLYVTGSSTVVPKKTIRVTALWEIFWCEVRNSTNLAWLSGPQIHDSYKIRLIWIGIVVPLYIALPKAQIHSLNITNYQKFLMSAKMRVDLFGREKQVVPTELVKAPLF